MYKSYSAWVSHSHAIRCSLVFCSPLTTTKYNGERPTQRWRQRRWQHAQDRGAVHALLSERGEASGAVLAREALAA